MKAPAGASPGGKSDGILSLEGRLLLDGGDALDGLELAKITPGRRAGDDPGDGIYLGNRHARRLQLPSDIVQLLTVLLVHGDQDVDGRFFGLALVFRHVERLLPGSSRPPRGAASIHDCVARTAGWQL